jgi:hypothetical protein
MQSINDLLKDYFNFINSYINPTRVSSNTDNKRTEKVNTLVNEITGDGNMNKKIIGVIAIVSEDKPIIQSEKSYQKTTVHQFYSPSSEF